MKSPLTDDDWCWLNWFLGIGAGSEMRRDGDSGRREKVVAKSLELVNKLGELRSQIGDAEE